MKETQSGGAQTPAGSIKLAINPPAPDRDGGVEFEAAWIRADMRGDDLRVSIKGQATFAGRTVTAEEVLELSKEPGLEPLRAYLAEVLAMFLPAVKTRTLEAAYEARTAARRIGEEV